VDQVCLAELSSDKLRSFNFGIGVDDQRKYPKIEEVKLFPHRTLLLAFAFWAVGTSLARAGSATDIVGLYYTGLNSGGGLQSGGARDANWDVTYARVGGTTFSGSSTYTSAAGGYVLSSFANTGGAANYIDAAYVANTSSAQWITAPGAMTTGSGGTVNVGGDFLPGNGTTGTNSALYVYQLAFNIVGTGSGVAKNQISISLTIAADDAYSIYVTPNAVTLNGSGALQTGGTSASATGFSAWSNTTAVILQNFGGGGANNTTFNIGTNYLTIVVNNTNSQTGTNSSTALNASGLLVYQVGALATIDGKVIPEAGTLLPLFGAVGLYGLIGWRRERRREHSLTRA